MRGHRTGAGRLALLVGGLLLAGCSSSTGDSGFSVTSIFARESAPAAAAAASSLQFAGYCPSVTVLEGGSALQLRSSQVVLGQLARECSEGPDGSTILKIGAEGRVILGAAGGGRFDVPVRFVVSDGATVYASRVRRAAVSINPGDANGFFAVVEEGIVVPASANVRGFDIEVGLGDGPRGRRG